jgi:curved DNA-binding protein CbpA
VVYLHFFQVNEAYKFLMDKGRREWYDNFPTTGDKNRGRNGTASNKENASAGGGLKVPPVMPHRAKSESGMRDVPTEQPVPDEDKPRPRAKSTGGDRDVQPEAECVSPFMCEEQELICFPVFESLSAECLSSQRKHTAKNHR